MSAGRNQETISTCWSGVRQLPVLQKGKNAFDLCHAVLKKINYLDIRMRQRFDWSYIKPP